MLEGASVLTLWVSDERAEPEELDELALCLRRELLGLDVAGVEAARDAQAPSGSRGTDSGLVGALIVTLCQPEVFMPVLEAISRWVGSDKHRTAKIQLGEDRLELTGLSAGQQQQLIDAWLHECVGR